MCATSLAIALTATAIYADPLSPREQNALVHKYCESCHTDAFKSGGLSLQSFDAAHVPPSQAAMMLNKLTGGASLQIVERGLTDPAAAALIARKVRGGALGASGVPRPDQTTIDKFIQSFAMQSKNTKEWTIQEEGEIITASILREVPMDNQSDSAETYRLVATCNPATRELKLQLAWSPSPAVGVIAASVDNEKPITLQRPDTKGDPTKLANIQLVGVRFPVKSLTISGLFEQQQVTFPFIALKDKLSGSWNACFAE